MKKETYDLAEVVPVEGKFTLEGQFSFNRTHRSKVGDLLVSDYHLSSSLGFSNISMVSGKQYSTVWESYEYNRGLICFAQVDQPFAGLFFQLGGSTQAIRTGRDLDLNMRSGESNLMIIPPMNESLEVREKLHGSTFGVLLTRDYLLDLTHRFPNQLEAVVDKIKKKDLCQLKERNLRITPRMRETIQRIKQLDPHQTASSLFLEAQVLDLLAMVITQLDQPLHSNSHSFSQADLEAIHMARDILLNRLESPPTLAELSRLVGSNEFLLKRGFREIFGTSPYAFHLQHKLGLARSYILDTQLTIAEIAYKVGYRDPAHFTKAFRKQYGTRPSDLR